jgi:hypothetical protein
MTAELTSISALAAELGWPRKKLCKYIRGRERELQSKGRPAQLIHGTGGKGSVYRVNRSHLELHCPELFEAKPPEEAVKVLREHLTETSRWIEECQGDLDEFRTELGAQAESVVTTYQELRDLIDFQNYTIAHLFQTVRALEARIRPNEPPSYAMDEGAGFSLPPKPVATNPTDPANAAPL